MDEKTAIKTRNIIKKFNGFTALNGISVSVPKGEVFGFIGKNGAGKTTFMRIVCGLIKPTGGTYEVDGKISFLPQNVRIRDNISTGDVLRFFAGLRGWDEKEGMKYANELELDLKKKTGRLSPGQQRKLQLAIVTIGLPEILVLDEPTAGLDPSGVQQVRSIVKKLNRMGSTVFISSHVLKELENLCGTIAVIDKGEILYQGNCRNVYEIETEGMDAKTIVVLREKLKCRFQLEGGMLTAEVERKEVPNVLRLLYEKDIKVFGVKHRGIETLYNTLVKEAGLN